TVRATKLEYYTRIRTACEHPAWYMSIIIDGCDSNTTVLPNIPTKSIHEAEKDDYLKHRLMGVRVHGYRKRDYVYLMPPWSATSVGVNLTLEALVRTLRYEHEWRAEEKISWPTTLYLQLDNTSKDNKNKVMFAFLS